MESGATGKRGLKALHKIHRQAFIPRSLWQEPAFEEKAALRVAFKCFLPRFVCQT